MRCALWFPALAVVAASLPVHAQRSDYPNRPVRIIVPQTAGGGWYYRSRITLDQINLHGTPANFHLIPGMPIQADIRVGKQTVLSYMMGRIMPLATEGMREP